MADAVSVDDLNRRLGIIRASARDVNIDGPWPAAVADNDGSNWKVQVYPTKRPSRTSCISVVDAVEYIRKDMPTVAWD